MSNLFPLGLLTDLAALALDSFTDSATIARTGAVVPCRINADTRELRTRGFPEYLRLPYWRVYFPATADVYASDTLTIAGKGNYVVLEIDAPTTTTAQLRTHCVQTARADGSLPIYTNNTVTFRRIAPNGTSTSTSPVAVTIWPLEYEEQLTHYEGRMTWRVLYPVGTTINGYPIAADDEIVWSELTAGEARLFRPVRYDSPIPYMLGTFCELS